MHHGVFQGRLADQQARRMLILSESHHGDDKGKAASYTTASVVEEDHIRECMHPFFSRIEQSFGCECGNEPARRDFWDRFYFGNYVDVLCGVRDDCARRMIKKNRQKYNDQLFTFVNENGIDLIFCFSRLAYEKLPSLSRKDRADEYLETLPCQELLGKRRDYIARCRYLPDRAHGAVTVPLKKELLVYGLRHPSAAGGFRPGNYRDCLREAAAFALV